MLCIAYLSNTPFILKSVEEQTIDQVERFGSEVQG